MKTKDGDGNDPVACSFIMMLMHLVDRSLFSGFQIHQDEPTNLKPGPGDICAFYYAFVVPSLGGRLLGAHKFEETGPVEKDSGWETKPKPEYQEKESETRDQEVREKARLKNIHPNRGGTYMQRP